MSHVCLHVIDTPLPYRHVTLFYGSGVIVEVIEILYDFSVPEKFSEAVIQWNILMFKQHQNRFFCLLSTDYIVLSFTVYRWYQHLFEKKNGWNLWKFLRLLDCLFLNPVLFYCKIYCTVLFSGESFAAFKLPRWSFYFSRNKRLD